MTNHTTQQLKRIVRKIKNETVLTETELTYLLAPPQNCRVKDEQGKIHCMGICKHVITDEWNYFVVETYKDWFSEEQIKAIELYLKETY